jgi:hypothetical protein
VVTFREVARLVLSRGLDALKRELEQEGER